MPPNTRKPIKTEMLAKLLPVFTGLIAVGYAVAVYAFLFMPKLGRLVPGGDLDLAPYQQRVAETSAYQTELKGLKSAYDTTNGERRARVQAMAPDSTQSESLYVLLDSIVQSHGGVLASIDVSPDERKPSENGQQSLHASAVIRGLDYEQLKLVLLDLERSERVIDVQSTVISAEATNYSIVFRAYDFDPERLRVPPTPDPALVAPVPAT